MKPGETLLEMVGRHVREGQGHIVRQRDLVRHLEETASPLAEEARVLLTRFALSQDQHESHLAQITEEIRSARRDAGGNLLSLQP